MTNVDNNAKKSEYAARLELDLDRNLRRSGLLEKFIETSLQDGTIERVLNGFNELMLSSKDLRRIIEVLISNNYSHDIMYKDKKIVNTLVGIYEPESFVKTNEQTVRMLVIRNRSDLLNFIPTEYRIRVIAHAAALKDLTIFKRLLPMRDSDERTMVVRSLNKEAIDLVGEIENDILINVIVRYGRKDLIPLLKEPYKLETGLTGESKERLRLVDEDDLAAMNQKQLCSIEVMNLLPAARSIPMAGLLINRMDKYTACFQASINNAAYHERFNVANFLKKMQKEFYRMD